MIDNKHAVATSINQSVAVQDNTWNTGARQRMAWASYSACFVIGGDAHDTALLYAIGGDAHSSALLYNIGSDTHSAELLYNIGGYAHSAEL